MSRPLAVVQPRLRIRLTEKKPAQVHCCWEIEALVVLHADLMIVRQICFLFTRRGVTQGNALFGRFWEQTFRQTVTYVIYYCTVEKVQYFPFGLNHLTRCHASFRWYLPSNWRVWEEDSQRIFATMSFPLESSWTTNPEAKLRLFWWNSRKIYNSIYSMYVCMYFLEIYI